MAAETFGRRSRAKRAVPVGEALKRLASSLGIAPKLKEMELLASWESVVGEQIARVAKAERIERGTLYVVVTSAPWRAELTLRRVELMDRLNDAAGRKVISEIRFR
jgi:predicted nucleic acid-binding Zn ribbon protein